MVSSVTGAYPETKVMICQGCEDSPFSCQGTRYGAFTKEQTCLLEYIRIL